MKRCHFLLRQSCTVTEFSFFYYNSLFWILFCLQDETELGFRPFRRMQESAGTPRAVRCHHVSSNGPSFRETLTATKSRRANNTQVGFKVCLPLNPVRAVSQHWEMSCHAGWDVCPLFPLGQLRLTKPQINYQDLMTPPHT